MNNLLTATMSCLTILCLNFGTAETANAKTVIKNYPVKDFSELRIGSAFEVEFIHSNENKVTVETDDEVAESVFVGTSGDELTIKLKEGRYYHTHALKAKVYGNSLERIFIGGASSFTTDFIFSEKSIDATVSGASKAVFAVKTNDLHVNVSGASKVTIKGSAGQQDADVSGASFYDAKGCISSDSFINSSGASKVILQCTDTLNVDARGASHITVINTPKKIHKSLSGASDLDFD